MTELSAAGWTAYLFLLCLALVARSMLGSWLEPVAALTVYWISFTTVSLVLLPRDQLDHGLIVVVLSIGCALVGAFAYRQGARHASFAVDSVSRLAHRDARLPAVLCALCGMLSVVIVLYSAGFSLGSVTTVQGLVHVSNTFSLQRYALRYHPPLVAQILLGAGYAGACFGGTLAAQARMAHVRRRGLLAFSLVTFLPSLAIMLIRSERAPFLLAAVLYISFYLAVGSSLSTLRLVPRRYLVIGIALAPLIVVLFAVIAMMRAGKSDLSMIPTLVNKVSSGAFGSLTSLSRWSTATRGIIDTPALGGYTAAGVYDLLGWKPRVIGLFQEYLRLATGYRSNVYTLFRPLIEDYGAGGSVLFWLLFGWLSARLRAGAVAGSTTGTIGLAACYAVVLYSFNTSPFAYNTILLAFLTYTAWAATGFLSGQLQRGRDRAAIPSTLPGPTVNTQR